MSNGEEGGRRIKESDLPGKPEEPYRPPKEPPPKERPQPSPPPDRPAEKRD
jgi:hypothetical protein